MTQVKKQNVTLSLNVQTLEKVRLLAAKRSISVSGLLTEQVQAMIEAEDEYERAAAAAIARLKQGFSMGGGPLIPRDELYDR